MRRFFFIFLTILFILHASTTLPLTPRISIITSVYRADLFIEGFLSDITRQTIFDACELIIINAHSPGTEEQVIYRYMKKHTNITYIKLPYDPGLYGVWNIAIKIARAPLITNSNVDDRRAPFSLDVLAKALEKDSSIELVYSPFYSTLIPNQTFEQHTLYHFFNYDDFSPWHMRYCLPGIQPMWRKSMHEKYGYFDENFKSAGDWEMWLRAVSKGAQFKKIPIPTGLYYKNPEGLSTNSQAQNTHATEVALLNEQYKYLWS